MGVVSPQPHQQEVILAEKKRVNQRLIRPKVGLRSPSTWESIINHIWLWFGHSYTHLKLFWLLKANPTNQTEICNEVSKQLTCACVNGCGLVMATPIGHHYA